MSVDIESFISNTRYVSNHDLPIFRSIPFVPIIKAARLFAPLKSFSIHSIFSITRSVETLRDGAHSYIILDNGFHHLFLRMLQICLGSSEQKNIKQIMIGVALILSCEAAIRVDDKELLHGLFYSVDKDKCVLWSTKAPPVDVMKDSQFHSINTAVQCFTLFHELCHIIYGDGIYFDAMRSHDELIQDNLSHFFDCIPVQLGDVIGRHEDEFMDIAHHWGVVIPKYSDVIFQILAEASHNAKIREEFSCDVFAMRMLMQISKPSLGLRKSCTSCHGDGIDRNHKPFDPFSRRIYAEDLLTAIPLLYMTIGMQDRLFDYVRYGAKSRIRIERAMRRMALNFLRWTIVESFAEDCFTQLGMSGAEWIQNKHAAAEVVSPWLRLAGEIEDQFALGYFEIARKMGSKYYMKIKNSPMFTDRGYRDFVLFALGIYDHIPSG